MKLIIFLLLLPLSLPAKKLNFKGIAYSSKNKANIIYSEIHTQTITNNKIAKSTTDYYNTNNLKFASLNTDYQKDKFFPDFKFLDTRTNYLEELNKKKDSFNISVNDKTIKTKVHNLKKNSSTGQGINEVIKAKLSLFEKGESTTTKFFLAGRMQFVSMLITGKSISKDKIQVKIMVKNIFLRLFAPKLEMIYDKASGRLLSYYGVSNILTSDGKSQKVYIEYNY